MYPRARLPGIYVDTVNPPPVEGLPRMDVAVFAGFAAAGPCHRAVAVDSVAAFEAVFGGDLALAFDKDRGETIHANLAPSVRAFFSNGGTHCWVIRLAMTKDLAALWADAGGAAIAADDTIATAEFAMAGLLARLPSGTQTSVAPARLAARSGGSWSDDLRLSARVLRAAISIDRDQDQLAATQKVPGGFSFLDSNGLAAGDLIEFTAQGGNYVRYARIVRVGDGMAWAIWIASFAPFAKTAASETGTAHIAGQNGAFEATLDKPANGPVRLIPKPQSVDGLDTGRWIEFTHQGESTWMMVDAIDTQKSKKPGGAESVITVATGRAWRQIGSILPKGRFAVCRVTLDVRARQDGASKIATGLGLCPGHGSAIQSLVDDDHFYAPTDRRTATARPPFAITDDEASRLRLPDPEMVSRFGSTSLNPADLAALRSAWLPLGLDGDFAPEAEAIIAPRRALARNGLSQCDHRVFLDPRLADLSMASLAAHAEQLRDLQDEQLFGIHAAIDIPSDLYSPASIIAVPDATQPDWRFSTDKDTSLSPQSDGPELTRWWDHQDGCFGMAREQALKAKKAKGSKGKPAPTHPDWSRFLDCATRELKAPVFKDTPDHSADGSFSLNWAAGEDGGTYILEEAGRHDFADAQEIMREASQTSFAVLGRAEGSYYYRLRAEIEGNSSAYALCRVIVRQAEDHVVPTDPMRLPRIHAAMLRLAAGTGDYFAILSLPRDLRAREAGSYARKRMQIGAGFGTPTQLGVEERRALSFGALYHPWLVSSAGSGKLLTTAPDGAIAGIYAKRATARGAWIAPANELIRDIVGLDPATPEADLLELDQSRVNAIRRLPDGFAMLDSDTLSGETEWQQVNVRRLMMLIRRAALRRGMPYVFEPNGPVVRRAIEHSFTIMLDDLQRRGAFAGKTSDQSFRLTLPEAANDRDTGRMTVEIAVSPAQPLRFLTLRMAQQGARLSIAEVA